MKNKRFLEIAAKKLFRVYREEAIGPEEYGFIEKAPFGYELYMCICPKEELDEVYTTPYLIGTLPRTARGLRKEVKRLRGL